MTLRIAIFAILSLSAFAQSEPELASREAPVTFSSRVNLVSVPVVVRDREGRAVGNLRQEDFQLFDKGKLQVITKFSVEKTEVSKVVAAAAPREKPQTPAPAPSVLPERYIAYLVDDIHLKAGDLLQTRRAMDRHLDESLEPASRAAIFTTSGLMLSDFTDDREILHNAVSRIQPWTSGPDPQQDCPPVSYYVADYMINKVLYLDGFLYTDVQLLAFVGQEPLLGALVTEAGTCSGLPLTEGSPPNDSPLLRQVRIAAHQALLHGERETTLGLGALKDVVRRLSATPGNRNLVLVSPGFLLTRDHHSEEYDVLDRAIRAKVTINTIDMRGLFTATPGGDASQRGYSSPGGTIALGQSDREAATQAADVLAEMAAGTGGTFFHNDNDLKVGLNLLAARPEYLYVLGFSPQNLKLDGSYHGLKVTVRNSSNLTLQVRRGYWAPNHAVDPAEAAREEIKEAVFSRDEIQDIPVDLQTEFFKSGDAKAELTVTARLDLKGLRFRKAEERNNDTLTVITGLFDRNGNYVAGIQRVVEMHLRDQTLAAMENSGITLKESFSVASGRYIVRVVVRDSEGQAMAARNGSVEIP